MERLCKRKLALPLAALGGVALGPGLALGIQAAQGPSTTDRVISAFERDYTDANRCLHDTPYDPTKGAFIDVRYDPTSTESIVSDTPLAANSHKPSVLLLSIQLNASEQFHPADYSTLVYLGKAACPGLPNGS